ncbi:MAG: hypothetical protein IJP62_10535 [Treponema sp.]|nr:hypothetical protein [Treponema sp.]
MLTITHSKDWEEYQKRIKDYAAAENEQRIDTKISLNDEEAILDNLLEMERNALVGNKDSYKRYPCISMFHETKESIEKTVAFRVLKQLPKGGNLHIHTSASWDAHEMIAEFSSGNNADNIYIYLGNAGKNHSKDSNFIHGKLFYFTDDAKELVLNWNKANFQEGRLCHLYEVPFDMNIEQLFTFSGKERMMTVDNAWDEFNVIFKRMSIILNIRKLFDVYYTKTFLKLIEDNISYVELRFGLTEFEDNHNYLLTENSINSVPSEEKVEESLKAIKKIADSLSDKITVRIIISGSRKLSTSSLDEDKSLAFLKYTSDWMSKDEYKKFIVGFDFVSEEDRNYTAKELAERIREYFKNATIPDMNFYFHDGETNWADNDNVMYATALGTNRIGHGYNLYRFPAVIDEVKKAEYGIEGDKQCCLEICPISNQELRYSSDLRTHPVSEYIKRGVPFVICSDDPQIFMNNGLTYDFWELYFSQPELVTLRTIKMAIQNSIEYSGMDDTTKNKVKTGWEQEWENTVHKIVFPNKDFENNEEMLLACAAMLYKYYDKLLAASDMTICYDLDGMKEKNGDFIRYTTVFFKKFQKIGISDENFIREHREYPNKHRAGIGDDGKFYPIEYFNVMYRIFCYLYGIKQSNISTLPNESSAESLVRRCAMLMSNYIDLFSGKAGDDMTKYEIPASELPKWKAIYTEMCSRGIIYNTLTRNFLPDDSGKFIGVYMMHLLYKCYEYLYFQI